MVRTATSHVTIIPQKDGLKHVNLTIDQNDFTFGVFVLDEALPAEEELRNSDLNSKLIWKPHGYQD